MIEIIYNDKVETEAGDRSSERQNSLIDAYSRTIHVSEEYESNVALPPPLIDASASVTSNSFMTVPSISPSKKDRKSTKKKKRRSNKHRRNKSAGPTSPSDYITVTESGFDDTTQFDDEQTTSVPEVDKKEQHDPGSKIAVVSSATLTIPVVNGPKPNSARSRVDLSTEVEVTNFLRRSISDDDFSVNYGPKKTRSEPNMVKPTLHFMPSVPISVESPGEEGILRVDFRENETEKKTELDVPDVWEQVEHESQSSSSLEKVEEEQNPQQSHSPSSSCWCFVFGRRRRKRAKYLESYTSMEVLKRAENVTVKYNNPRQEKNGSVRDSGSKHSVFRQSESGISVGGENRDTETSVEFLERLTSIKLLPRNTNLLVLDMDETLVHSSGSKMDKYDMLVMAGDNLEHEVYVKKRPFVDDFLRACSKFALIFVFTASNQNYADPVLNALDKNLVVKKRFYKPDCIRYDGRRYDKPLSKVGHPIENTILVDNSPDSWRSNPHNAVRVSSWFDNPYDTQLLELIPILETFFLHYKDIRHVLDGNRRSFKWLKDKAKILNPAINAKYKHLEKFKISP